MAHYWLFLQEYDNHPKKRSRTSLPSHKKQITYEKNHYSQSKIQWKKYVCLWQGNFQALCIFTEVGPNVLQKSMGLLADCRNFPVTANKVSTALVSTSPLTNPAWWWYACFFLKAIPWNSCTRGDWGDGTAGKVLVAQVWAPPFSPPNPHEEPGVGLPTYNPSSGEAETSRSLGLTGQPNFQALGQMRGPVSKHKVDSS